MADSFRLGLVMTSADNISAVQHEEARMSRQVYAPHTRSGSNED